MWLALNEKLLIKEEQKEGNIHTTNEANQL